MEDFGLVQLNIFQNYFFHFCKLILRAPSAASASGACIAKHWKSINWSSCHPGISATHHHHIILTKSFSYHHLKAFTSLSYHPRIVTISSSYQTIAAELNKLMPQCVLQPGERNKARFYFQRCISESKAPSAVWCYIYLLRSVFRLF